MFTGIVQGTAKIISIYKKTNIHTYVIELPDHLLDKISIGASIALNGCCLTITKINAQNVLFDVIKETLRTTNLCELVEGDLVNIERAAKLNDEIGGHLMTGHIITTAEIAKISTLKNNYQIWFKIQKKASVMKYILHKGFIGIDGVSLTVGEVMENCFCVYLIPETLRRTTLSTKKIGQHVNLEIDSQTQAIVDTVEHVLSSAKGIKCSSKQAPVFTRYNLY